MDAHARDVDGLEVKYRDIMADIAPPSLLDLPAGKVAQGVFYPYGSVAAHFFQLHQMDDNDTAKAPSDVYFIRSQRGGPVKIGMARKPVPNYPGCYFISEYIVRMLCPLECKEWKHMSPQQYFEFLVERRNHAVKQPIPIELIQAQEISELKEKLDRAEHALQQYDSMFDLGAAA